MHRHVGLLTHVTLLFVRAALTFVTMLASNRHTYEIQF